MLTTQPAPSSHDEERFEAIYAEHFEFLVGVAVQKFHIHESEAETLVHEVFLSYLKKHESVRELRPWLIGAICHASRHYWRLNRRMTPSDPQEEMGRIDPASTRILDSLPDQLAARQALECLSPRCQRVLYLRYFEGCSILELAERMG